MGGWSLDRFPSITRLTQRDGRSFTPMAQLESLINLKSTSLDCGREPRRLVEDMQTPHRKATVLTSLSITTLHSHA